jgi:hypothetical protein
LSIGGRCDIIKRHQKIQVALQRIKIVPHHGSKRIEPARSQPTTQVDDLCAFLIEQLVHMWFLLELCCQRGLQAIY